MNSNSVLHRLATGDKIVKYTTRPANLPLIVLESGPTVTKQVFEKLEREGLIELVRENKLVKRYGVKQG